MTGARPSDRLGSARGVTLLEVTIVLTSVVILIGILAPTLSAVVRNAETTAATTAMNKIRDAVIAMVDTDSQDITTTGAQSGGPVLVQLIVSDGDIPRELVVTGDSARWDDVVNTSTGLTDFIENHLVLNDPVSSTSSYSTTSASPWKGAYLTAPIDPDPWGNRYGVNVQYMGGGGSGANDVVVHSSGPDEEIETPFTANPVTAGGDDLIVLVEA